jgi:hypothetical protein
MDENSKIPVGEGPLTDLHLRILEDAAGLIIPDDEMGVMPAASQVDLRSYLRERKAEEVQLLLIGIDALAGFIAQKHLDSDPAPDESVRNRLITEFALGQPDLWQLLVLTTYSCYYQDERVLLALGLDARPPFPRGNEVAPGDLSLLDPVRQRSSFYR